MLLLRPRYRRFQQHRLPQRPESGECHRKENSRLSHEIRPEIYRFFENFAVHYVTFSALHSTGKFSHEQQIFELSIENTIY